MSSEISLSTLVAISKAIEGKDAAALKSFTEGADPLLTPRQDGSFFLSKTLFRFAAAVQRKRESDESVKAAKILLDQAASSKRAPSEHRQAPQRLPDEQQWLSDALGVCSFVQSYGAAFAQTNLGPILAHLERESILRLTPTTAGSVIIEFSDDARREIEALKGTNPAALMLATTIRSMDLARDTGRRVKAPVPTPSTPPIAGPVAPGTPTPPVVTIQATRRGPAAPSTGTVAPPPKPPVTPHDEPQPQPPPPPAAKATPLPRTPVGQKTEAPSPASGDRPAPHFSPLRALIDLKAALDFSDIGLVSEISAHIERTVELQQILFGDAPLATIDANASKLVLTPAGVALIHREIDADPANSEARALAPLLPPLTEEEVRDYARSVVALFQQQRRPDIEATVAWLKVVAPQVHDRLFAPTPAAKKATDAVALVQQAIKLPGLLHDVAAATRAAGPEAESNKPSQPQPATDRLAALQAKPLTVTVQKQKYSVTLNARAEESGAVLTNVRLTSDSGAYREFSPEVDAPNHSFASVESAIARGRALVSHYFADPKNEASTVATAFRDIAGQIDEINPGRAKQLVVAAAAGIEAATEVLRREISREESAESSVAPEHRWAAPREYRIALADALTDSVTNRKDQEVRSLLLAGADPFQQVPASPTGSTPTLTSLVRIAMKQNDRASVTIVSYFAQAADTKGDSPRPADFPTYDDIHTYSSGANTQKPVTANLATAASPAASTPASATVGYLQLLATLRELYLDQVTDGSAQRSVADLERRKPAIHGAIFNGDACMATLDRSGQLAITPHGTKVITTELAINPSSRIAQELTAFFCIAYDRPQRPLTAAPAIDLNKLQKQSDPPEIDDGQELRIGG